MNATKHEKKRTVGGYVSNSELSTFFQFIWNLWKLSEIVKNFYVR